MWISPQSPLPEPNLAVVLSGSTSGSHLPPPHSTGTVVDRLSVADQPIQCKHFNSKGTRVPCLFKFSVLFIFRPFSWCCESSPRWESRNDVFKTWDTEFYYLPMFSLEITFEATAVGYIFVTILFNSSNTCSWCFLCSCVANWKTVDR